jgi:alpha/beta superfamily hydrolase
MRQSVENIIFEGPAGQLEGLFESQRNEAPVASVVICHPHPLHGGTMQNKVVHTLARAFVRQQFGALRFNFRGVGQSGGEYDEGRGELQDAFAAIRWMRERVPDLPLWLAGFSFGAAIAIQAALETELRGLISVAPAAARLSQVTGLQPDCPWLIIHGDQDELVDIDETVAWVNELEPGPELAIFRETTHFFHGKLVPLRRAVEIFVSENLA